MKKKSIKILLLVLGIIGALALVTGIVALTGRGDKADDGFELVKAEFERGGLTDDGIYVETKSSIYTKNSFEVGEGIKVKLEFDSKVKYQVYFYTENDKFVEASEEYTTSQSVLPASETGTHARIVVTPIWDADVKADDQVIGYFEVNKYAKNLTITYAPSVEAEAE